jgi:hypothetical protein
MLSDLGLAAMGFWGYDQATSSRAGTSSPSVSTTSRDDTSWSPTWAAWWPAGCYSVDGDPPVGRASGKIEGILSSRHGVR